MSRVQLLAFTSADFDTWYPLWRGYQAFYKVDIAEDVSRTTWERLLDPQEPMNGTFALVDGAALGIVHFIEHRIGLIMLIAASLLAIAVSLVAPQWAMLAYLVNLLDGPLRWFMRRQREAA